MKYYNLISISLPIPMAMFFWYGWKSPSPDTPLWKHEHIIILFSSFSVIDLVRPSARPVHRFTTTIDLRTICFIAGSILRTTQSWKSDTSTPCLCSMQSFGHFSAWCWVYVLVFYIPDVAEHLQWLFKYPWPQWISLKHSYPSLENRVDKHIYTQQQNTISINKTLI